MNRGGAIVVMGATGRVGYQMAQHLLSALPRPILLSLRPSIFIISISRAITFLTSMDQGTTP